MRFVFKTDYAQDIRLAKHGGHVFWYSLLMVFLLAAPWLIAEYWLAQLTLVLIYSIAGLGLGAFFPAARIGKCSDSIFSERFVRSSMATQEITCSVSRMAKSPDDSA